MIKRLKYTFVAISMGFVILLLCVIFGLALFTTRKGMEKDSHDFLMNVMFLDKSFLDIEEAPVPPQEMIFPFIVIQMAEDNSYTVYVNQSFSAAGSTLDDIVAAVINQESDYGTINNGALRYLRASTKDGLRISVQDIAMENKITAEFVRNMIVMILVALALCFIFSLFLAEWATKPVRKSWEDQKRFVADASHELRTPLTVILSNSALLTKDEFIKAQEKPYNRALNINSEARRMKLLVEDLLDLARHDSLKQKISLSKIDLSYIVLKTIMKFEAAIYDSGKKLRYDIDDGLCISGNTEQIQKLLGIFIDNAIKYSAKNGSISIELHKSGKGRLVLSFQNDGPAIPEDKFAKIFDRFYRVSEDRQNNGGFGLGLSIAKAIAKEHDAKITVLSAEDTGTVFNISFPSAYFQA